jgi:hypothetical protein
MAILKRRLVREKKSPEARQPDGQVSQDEVSADNAIPAQTPTAPVNSNPAPSAAPVQTDMANPDVALESNAPAKPDWTLLNKRKLSLVQIVLILGIILSASFLTYSLIESQSPKQSPMQASASFLPSTITETNDTQQKEEPKSGQQPTPPAKPASGEPDNPSHRTNRCHCSLWIITTPPKITRQLTGPVNASVKTSQARTSSW